MYLLAPSSRCRPGGFHNGHHNRGHTDHSTLSREVAFCDFIALQRIISGTIARQSIPATAGPSATRASQAQGQNVLNALRSQHRQSLTSPERGVPVVVLKAAEPADPALASR